MRRILYLCGAITLSACSTLEDIEVVSTKSEPLKPQELTLVEQDTIVREAIREHIDDPLMEVIAGCESTGSPKRIQHWNADGTLIANPTSSARGALQTLLYLHRHDIAARELDMRGSLADYMAFNRHLRDTQGYNAWRPSRHCWGRYRHLGVT